MKGRLVFATVKLEQQWKSGQVPPLLRRIVEWIVDRRWERMKVATIVTSIFRPNDRMPNGKPSPHASWRAVDVDAIDDRLAEEEAIRQEVLARFPTGVPTMPRVPVLTHGTGPHFHIQVTWPESKAA